MPDLTDEDRARIRDVFTDHGYAGDPVLVVDAAIYRAGLATVRARALEEAARVCDDMKTAAGAGQILIECAAAIRALQP